MEKKRLGLYVHIPFCKRKCYYCDFISYDNCINKEDEYIESLLLEIENSKNNSVNEFDDLNDGNRYNDNEIITRINTKKQYKNKKYWNNIIKKKY